MDTINFDLLFFLKCFGIMLMTANQFCLWRGCERVKGRVEMSSASNFKLFGIGLGCIVLVVAPCCEHVLHGLCEEACGCFTVRRKTFALDV